MHMKPNRWSPGFSKLLTGETLSAISGSAVTVALPIIAVTQLRANAFEAAAMAACAQAAPLLFGLSAGAIADRLDRRLLLVACNAVRALILILLFTSVLTSTLNLPLLGIAGFLLSCTQLLSEAVMASAIPALVKRSQLTWANGWFQGVGSTAQAVGPLTAGLTIQWGAMGPLFMATALAHVASCMLFSRLHLNDAQSDANDDVADTHLAQILQGVVYIWRDGVQRAIAISTAIFNFFHAAFFAIFPIYALTVLDLSPATLGMLFSGAGLAGLVAAMCAERLIDRFSIPVTLIGSLFIILPFSLLVTFGALTPFPFNAILIVIAFAGWDFAVVLNIVIEQSIRQATVPSDLVSRASSTQRFVSWGLDPIGALAGGALAVSPLGLGHTLTLSMWGMGLAGLVLLFSRDIRALPKAFADDLDDE